jgi:REP element-mobilizing transposase RayT
MSHSFLSALFHCVFSTRDRRKFITPQLEERLWLYMGGIAREHNIRPLAIGGVEDHVHWVLALPRTMDIAKAMQLIKGGSSSWVHQEFSNHRMFGWQEGYGAFSLGISQLEKTKRYIANQRGHHRVRTFKEEFVTFLEKHGIEYDAETIWL